MVKRRKPDYMNIENLSDLLNLVPGDKLRIKTSNKEPRRAAYQRIENAIIATNPDGQTTIDGKIFFIEQRTEVVKGKWDPVYFVWSSRINDLTPTKCYVQFDSIHRSLQKVKPDSPQYKELSKIVNYCH
jgi:hypothetical protein